MQCPFCKVDVGNQDELQLHCLVCTTAYAGSYKCMFVTKRLIFLMVLVDETVLIHSSDDNLSEENLFLQAFFWSYTEPRTLSTEPSVDSVVVRFRWVKSRPCFAREIHLISSLVSIFNPHSEQTCNLRKFFFQSSTFLYVINTLMWLSGSRHEITDHESFVYFHFSVVVFSWLLLLEFWFSFQRSS